MNYIITEKKHEILTITLNRPEVHNAFDDTMIQELIATLAAAETDKNLRVVVLKANGKSFSAGADLTWMQRMVNYTEAENYQDSKQLAKLMQLLNFLNKPTIAVIQGPAIGGGVGLIACCDIAIASENVFFCFSEVKIGIMPAVISPYVINAIGQRAARRYFLTAEKISSKEALHLNLIHKIVTVNELAQAEEDIINNLLASSPAAIHECKKLIEDFAEKDISQTLIDETSKRIAKIRISKEGQEGLNAFLQKRSPSWKDNLDNN